MQTDFLSSILLTTLVELTAR